MVGERVPEKITIRVRRWYSASMLTTNGQLGSLKKNLADFSPSCLAATVPGATFSFVSRTLHASRSADPSPRRVVSVGQLVLSRVGL